MPQLLCSFNVFVVSAHAAGSSYISLYSFPLVFSTHNLTEIISEKDCTIISTVLRRDGGKFKLNASLTLDGVLFEGSVDGVYLLCFRMIKEIHKDHKDMCRMY